MTLGFLIQGVPSIQRIQKILKTQKTLKIQKTQDTQDTEEPRIIAQEGTWDVRNVQLISDVCNLGDYEDVTSFVPAEFEVSNADESGFNLDPETRCDVDENYQISCGDQTITQNVLWDVTSSLPIDLWVNLKQPMIYLSTLTFRSNPMDLGVSWLS